MNTGKLSTALCLEEKEENGAAERTQDAFSPNFLKQFQTHTAHYTLLSPRTAIICFSVCSISEGNLQLY